MDKLTSTPIYEHGMSYPVKVLDLHPNPNQPRKYFREEGMEGLKVSIEFFGLIQPITFTLIAGELVIVFGERRWRAARAAGFEYIQAIYVDRDITEIALAENFQREDLNAMEKAEAVLLLKMHGANYVQISKIIGKSISSISELLSLNRLPESIKSECRMSTKYVLTRLMHIAKEPDQKTMRRLFKAYQRELDGGNQNGVPRSSHPISRLTARIRGMRTQILKTDVNSTTEKIICAFFSEMHGMEQAIGIKASEYIQFHTSVSRNNEEKP